jgi:hypothetical protein
MRAQWVKFLAGKVAQLTPRGFISSAYIERRGVPEHLLAERAAPS